MIPSVLVYTSDAHDDVLVGACHFSLRRGTISSSFVYDQSYLASAGAYAIDPSLPLRNAAGFCEGLPGALRDSAPDRWGRHLIDRRAIAEANTKKSALQTRDEVDYLLGVYDASRQGALRFRMTSSGNYLSPNESVPPLVNLKRLIAASNQVSLGNAGNDQVKDLLDAGSGSLGGARPKASVTDGNRLLLAKFSHPGDEWDVMAWEKTSLDVAKATGLTVPAAKLLRIGPDSVLLLERFDREDSLMNGLRIPYLSAMSLVSAHDGSQCDYADVADALVDWCQDPLPQLESLFTRVTLSIALHNTDDHLRNLGLLRRGGQWVLSPVFDVNINPDSSRQRVTSVFGETGRLEIDGLRELAETCGLTDEKSTSIVAKVVRAAQSWRNFARRNGCKEAEAEFMSRVVDERTQALHEAFN